MKALIALPSYNERENIVQLTQAILDLDPDFHVCIVDDSSPDGTAQLLETERRARAGWTDRVELIVRSKKDGRGGAVREALSWGIAQPGFAAFVEMDCDFSHEPSAIARGVALLQEGHDVAIGSRYPDGEIIGWPLSRRVFSFFANTLARALIDWSIPDYTNGFRFYSRRAAAELLEHQQKHKGYIYLSETLSHLLRAKMSIATFPIRFKNRERGVSNTSLREIRSALGGIFSIALDHRLGPR
jgi:dolichol-phosphate mannosyltransferase